MEHKVLLRRQKNQGFASSSSSSPSDETSPLLHSHPSAHPSNLTQSTLVSLADTSTPTNWTFWALVKLPNVKIVLTSYFFLSWLGESLPSTFSAACHNGELMLLAPHVFQLTLTTACSFSSRTRRLRTVDSLFLCVLFPYLLRFLAWKSRSITHS